MRRLLHIAAAAMLAGCHRPASAPPHVGPTERAERRLAGVPRTPGDADGDVGALLAGLLAGTIAGDTPIGREGRLWARAETYGAGGGVPRPMICLYARETGPDGATTDMPLGRWGPEEIPYLAEAIRRGAR